MNALYLSARKLLPLTGGAELASNGLLQYLNSLGINTTILSFYEKNDYTDEEVKELKKYSARVRSTKLKWKNIALNLSFKYPSNIRKYTRSSMYKMIREEVLTKQYDLIIADHLQMFEYCKLGILKNSRIVLNEHNVEYKVWESYSERCKKSIMPFVILMSKRIKKYEAEACKMSDLVLAISEEDKKSLLELEPNSRIEVLTPGIKFERIKTEEDIRNVSNTILFVGSYSWYPNRKAAEFLVEELMPILRKKRNGIRLYLVGKCPTDEIIEYGKKYDDVIVTGMVESVEPYFKRSDIFVNAVTDGGGMNIKMLEAMGRGIPVISTTFGMRGINLDDSNCIKVFNDSNECADLIIRMLDNPQDNIEVANEARQFYEKYVEPPQTVKDILFE